MKTTYKEYTVNYKFRGSVWENETLKVFAMNKELAEKQVLNEIAGVYGNAILKDVIIKSVN
jgi:hypothetical protein